MSDPREARRNEFYAYWQGLEATTTPQGLKLGPHDVMFSWETRLMRDYARHMADPGSDVLEIGFGLGLSANAIQKIGVRSHTIVEALPQGFEEAQRREASQSGTIPLIHDFWQNCEDRLGQYDGILFDPYSLHEHLERDCLHFFDLAADKLLRRPGKLAWAWFETDFVPEPYQRKLLDRFRKVVLHTYRLRPNELDHFPRQRLVIPVAYI